MLRTRATWLKALAVGAVALLAAPAHTAEFDVLTPSDAQFIITINVRQAIDSPLAKKKGYAQKLKEALETEPQAKQLMAALGLDPLKDINSITLAAAIPENLTGKSDKGLIVVRGNFDQDKIEATAKKEPKIKTTVVGTRTVYEFKGDGDPLFGTFLDKTTIVGGPSKDYLLANLKGGAKPNAALVKSLESATGKESLWMGGLLPAEVKKQAAGNPQLAPFAALDSAATVINITDAITVDVYLNADNAANAGKVKAMIDQFLPLLGVLTASDEKVAPIVKKITNNIKVAVKGNTVNINLKITEDIIDDLIKLSGGK